MLRSLFASISVGSILIGFVWGATNAKWELVIYQGLVAIAAAILAVASRSE